jgi:hypothetical protein
MLNSKRRRIKTIGCMRCVEALQKLFYVVIFVQQVMYQYKNWKRLHDQYSQGEFTASRYVVKVDIQNIVHL